MNDRGMKLEIIKNWIIFIRNQYCVHEEYEDNLGGYVWRSEGMIWKPSIKRPRGMNRVQDLKLLNVRNTEKCVKGREGWKQYIVAAIVKAKEKK